MRIMRWISETGNEIKRVSMLNVVLRNEVEGKKLKKDQKYTVKMKCEKLKH